MRGIFHFLFQFSVASVLFVCLTPKAASAQVDLSFYLNQAKANSPLLKDNLNQAEAAKFDVERIRASFAKPQVILTGTLAFSPIISRDNGKSEVNFSPSDANNYSGYDIAASNGGVYQGLVNVNQNLFTAGKIQTASQQALIGARINQNNLLLGSHDIEKLVTDQYILCLQDLRQTSYINGLIRLLQDQKALTVKLVESGILKHSDYLLVNLEYQTQLNAANAFQATYRRDLMDLNVLCGINDTVLVQLKEISLNMVQDAAQSHFTERFHLDSLNLVATQKSFELKYKPMLSAFANAGLNGVYVPTLPNRFGMSAGLNFSMYIFDGRQKDLFKNRTDLLIKSTMSYKSNFLSQNAVRKSRLLNEIKSLDERMEISRTQLKDYNELLSFYKRELIAGQQSVVTYINTIKSVALVQRDYVLMQSNKQLLINAYNYWNW